MDERQVFDISPVKMQVTSHQVDIKICTCCGAENKGIFPKDVTHKTQYGTNLKTWVSVLSVQHFIPLARISQLISDMTGYGISEATITKILEVLSQKIEPATTAIKQGLLASKVLHFDETGLRVCGKRQWLHSASSLTLTFYYVDEKRGTSAMNEASILPDFLGIACHDHWKPYFTYDCMHALCNVHHLRELRFFSEEHENIFSSRISSLLLEIYQAKKRHKSSCFSQKKRQLYEKRYDSLLQESFIAHPRDKSRVKQSKFYNLLRRLRDYKEAVLLFMNDFDVPFSNNLAEQDVRMMKVKQKISGSFRSQDGARIFADNRGYVSTLRKNKENIFDGIRSAFEGNPFIPQLSQPCDKMDHYRIAE